MTGPGAWAARLRPLRRVLEFDLNGMVSLALWVTGRRHGVPPGAIAVSYARAQTPTMLVFAFAMVVELVGLEVLLRAVGAADAPRRAVLAVDGYSVVVTLAVVAACVTRPHVVSADELRVRYGAFFDLRVPRDLIARVRHVPDYNARGLVRVQGDRLTLAVAAQTNLVVELLEPVTATRPFGRRVRVRTIRCFADDPRAALAALRPQPESVP